MCLRAGRDREQFYGFRARPVSASAFEEAYRAAACRDNAEWERLFGRLTIDNSARYQEQIERHVAGHGSHASRFLEEYPVEFAFMTNDAVWWVATRERAALDEVTSYAACVPGMIFGRTVAFGF